MRLLPLLACGCLLPDLSHTLDPGPPVETEPVIELVIDTSDTGATPLFEASLVVDATDYEAWTALDLDRVQFVDHADATWELAFQRYHVDLQEGLEAAAIEGAAFDDVSEAPADGWRVDEPDADEDGVPEYALADWYDYDETTHRLSPAARTYVIRSTDGAAFKLGFDSYYDENGTPARVAIRLGALEAP